MQVQPQPARYMLRILDESSGYTAAPMDVYSLYSQMFGTPDVVRFATEADAEKGLRLLCARLCKESAHKETAFSPRARAGTGHLRPRRSQYTGQYKLTQNWEEFILSREAGGMVDVAQSSEKDGVDDFGMPCKIPIQYTTTIWAPSREEIIVFRIEKETQQLISFPE